MIQRLKCTFCGHEAQIDSAVGIGLSGWTQVSCYSPKGNRHICACPKETAATIAAAVRDALK